MQLNRLPHACEPGGGPTADRARSFLRARPPAHSEGADVMQRNRDAFTFSSESVSEGHPDKLADRISDAVLDLYLSRDPRARVACETLVTRNFVCIAGEVRSRAEVTREEIDDLARRVILDVGYDGFDERFGHESAVVDVRLQPQSSEIGAAGGEKTS